MIKTVGVLSAALALVSLTVASIASADDPTPTPSMNPTLDTGIPQRGPDAPTNPAWTPPPTPWIYPTVDTPQPPNCPDWMHDRCY